jgi:predicted DNA-binding transcriptional regulator YafY
MQESRLFKIVYHLLNEGQATAAELAALFEVSVRTIYRDIDALSIAGIPVYAVNGRKGGIRLLEGFVLDKSTLSRREQEEIIFGLQGLSAIRYPNANEVASKLGALFQFKAQNWIEVDLSRWGTAALKENNLFNLLKNAILEREKIQFDYYNADGCKSDRVVEPVKMIYKDKSWYLLGYCLKRNDWRLFRVSRIKNAVSGGGRFERFYDENKRIFPPRECYAPTVDLLLVFTQKAVSRLYDVLDEDLIVKDGEAYKVTVALPNDDWLYEFLMSFGEKVTVVEPDTVKKELAARYKRAVEALNIPYEKELKACWSM